MSIKSILGTMRPTSKISGAEYSFHRFSADAHQNKTHCKLISHTSVMCAVLICAIVLIFTGCSKNKTAASRTQKTTLSVSDVIQQRIAEEDNMNNNAQNTISEPVTTSTLTSGTSSTTTISNNATTTVSTQTTSDVPAPQPLALATNTTPAHKKPASIKSENVSVDVDLTTLSSTMVYSEVLNIMTYPETYVGKSIKMRGIFAYYHDEQTDKYYFGCIIQDATACCAQGIEFILTDDYLFPDDYPNEGEIVTVAGEFLIYKENGLDYFTLKDSKLLS